MRRAIAYIFLFSLLATHMSSGAANKELSAGKQASVQAQHAQITGEDVFKAQCSRCHTPPMSISPRTTGTVIMHMRVRARLSRRDEQLLLKYMAP